ncbi:MAG: HAD family hydrolase [Clostridium sp.]
MRLCERRTCDDKKGILFDMDGTLINTYENINFRQALSELKTVQKTLILKILKSRVRSFAEMETRILQEVEDPAEGKELVRRVSDFLLEHYDNAPLKKDALMFLQYVKQKNYKICLCTNNATEIVSHILREKHMEAYFDYVITSQQVTRSKPDPQMYLEALHNIDLTAEECIVFEDTENGVMAARNAGIDVIVVNDKEKRKYSDALMTIRDFGDYRLYQEF